MNPQTWLAFAATETVLCFIPGPAVLFVISAALARGARPGMAAALGILAGNAFYFALSATSIAGVIVASHELFSLLRWAGAAYLVWIGIGMLLARREAPARVVPRRIKRSFVRGFVVQAANPKALIFFVALLPQFIDPRAGVGPQVAILAVTSISIELAVLALYVAGAVRARRLASGRWAGSLERLGGAFLVATGIRLALVRQE